ncbi:MAG: heavy metal-binding domain-containing protein [Clostridiales bacterium]|nr:heavy metal-binding domain-containing protein [Clostridiales bacterium]
MIITTCETIPGKELEYLGLVSGAIVAGFAGNRKILNAVVAKMVGGLEEELSSAASGQGADAVVGVKFLFEQSVNLAIGTAVKFK